ncbi:FldA protein [Klebsiella pneumoniae ISC21]|nr:FldA protein [Klebsiella pneumoniae ISC21]
MRGGTSKAACFLADDLPADPVQRDAVLLAVMGSPDPRQIDGIGGADPLTSKVAIIRRSARPDADVDYLFAQVNVAAATVDYGQKLRQYSCRRWPFRHRARSGSPRCAAHSGAYFYGEHGATGGGRDPL